MAGIDRSRIVAKDEDEIYDFICGICHELFTHPMVTPCCQVTYCRECIEEWLTTSNICPNDRLPLTRNGLSKASRAFVNQMNNMRIKCRLSDKGCPSVHKIDQDEEHMKVCEFATCKKCGFNEHDVSHDCLTYLLEVKLNLNEDNDKLKAENEELIEVNLNLNQTNDNLKTDLDISREEVMTMTQKFVDLQRNYEISESALKTEIAELKKANRDLNATQMEIREVNNGLESQNPSNRQNIFSRDHTPAQQYNSLYRPPNPYNPNTNSYVSTQNDYRTEQSGQQSSGDSFFHLSNGYAQRQSYPNQGYDRNPRQQYPQQGYLSQQPNQGYGNSQQQQQPFYGWSARSQNRRNDTWDPWH